MPTVLMMIIAGLALGGAAITASVGAQRTSTRDQASKEALAAADAGLQQAIYRQNKVVTSDAVPCTVLGLGGDLIAGLPTADGWCPEVSGTVGDATFRYRVKPSTLIGTLQNQREITAVAIGESGGVERRIAIGARAQTGQAIFAGADFVGLDGVDIDDSSELTGDVGSNGSVNVSDPAYLCGDVTYGFGGGLNGDVDCNGFGSGEGEFSMPPPLQGTVPPSAGGNNSNARMFAGDGCVGTCDTKSGQVSWNPATRVLTMQGNQTVTLGGGLPYSFCRIDMSGSSTLIAAGGATVRIYFDTPENCGQTNSGGSCDSDPPSSYTQLSVIGNAKLLATSSDPKDFSFMFVGSDQCPTSAVLTGNSSSVNEVVLYGPRTDMQLNGSATLLGAMTGKTARTDGNSIFLADPDISDFDVSIALQYRRTRYIECSGTTNVSPPNANC